MSLQLTLRKAQNKRVILKMHTGAKYLGILHNSSDEKIVLSELCIIHKSGTSSMSGSNEKRSFLVNKIQNIMIQ
jgi:small nuclear ribonucleoprotein (snRNP)-like protein